MIRLMIGAGIGVHLEEMIKTGRPALLAGTLGVLAPVVLTVGVVAGLGYDLSQSVFLGLLAAPDTGLLFIVPVEQAWGLRGPGD